MKTALSIFSAYPCSWVTLSYRRPLFEGMPHIKSPYDADALLKKHIDTHQLDLRESFWVILMTYANRVLGISEVATGTALGVPINTRYILQLALLSNSSSVIVAHCHPSGNLHISESDLKETEKLGQALKLLDITLLDHLILTSESFLSMSLEGKL